MANLSNINNRFIVSDAGHVSIGNVTTNTYLVHAKSSGINNAILALESSSWSAGASAELRLSYVAGHERSIKGGYATGLEFYTNNATPAITILPGGSASGATGNVGIGVASLQPWAKLQVAGTAGAQTGAKQALYVTSPSTTAGEGVGIRLSAASGSHEAVGIIGMVNNASGNSGSMTFHTYNGGADFPERMRITNTGNVGIGTDSPDNKLDIALTTAAISFDTAIKVSANTDPVDYTANRGAGILFQNAEPYVAGIYGIRPTLGGWRGHLLFYTHTSASNNTFGTTFTEKMRITDEGKVGIGTTSPGSKLTVNGQVQVGPDAARRYALQPSQWGYSSSYRTLILGSASTSYNTNDTGSVTLAFGVDVSGNPSGSFTGNGKELLFRNFALFNTPNSSNNGYLNLLTFNDGNVGINTTSPGSKLEIGVTQSNTMTPAAAAFAIKGSGGDGLVMGQRSSSPYAAWLQAGYLPTMGTSNHYPIALQPHGGNVGIGTTSPAAKLQVNGSISSGTATAPTQIIYDSNGNVRSFTHNFTEDKNTPSARNVTFVDISGVGNFHQSFFYVQYGTRLQSVSDSTTGVVIRTYGVNRFNGGTLQVTETNAIAGSSNSLTHALVSVAIVSNTQYRVIVEFSSTIGPSSFVSGEIKGYGVGDSFPTITFAEGAAA